jgi:hypothetical protein
VASDGAVWTSPYLIVFPAHALLIVEERLKDQESEGVRMPEGVGLDELAIRILVVGGYHVRTRRFPVSPPTHRGSDNE